MLDDEEYIDYGLQLAFTVLTMAGTLLVDLSQPVTLVFALGIPVLFGHTAYISRDSFSKASSASIIALVFAPIGLVIAFLAVLLIFTNLMISIFASGNSFREFYGSTSMPLIVVGLMLGTIITVSMAVDPAFEQQAEEEFIDFMAWKTDLMIEETGVLEDQKEAQQGSMEDMHQAITVSLQAEVINYYLEEGGSDTEILQDAFNHADQELQQSLEEEPSEDLNQTEKIEEQIESMTSNVVEDRMMYLVIPLLVLGLYAFQPLIGLLTAISAKSFSMMYREFN